MLRGFLKQYWSKSEPVLLRSLTSTGSWYVPVLVRSLTSTGSLTDQYWLLRPLPGRDSLPLKRLCYTFRTFTGRVPHIDTLIPAP